MPAAPAPDDALRHVVVGHDVAAGDADHGEQSMRAIMPASRTDIQPI